MSKKQSILLALAILFLFSLLFLTIFGESGLADLNLLRGKRDRIVEENERVTEENLTMYREIDRLGNDLDYVEQVARDDLGMVKREEVIIKPKESRRSKGR